MYASLPLSPSTGQLTLRKRNSYFYIYHAAGFFAKSHMMFFLLPSFRFYPPLKNDGRSELRFREAINDFLPKKESIGNVSRPRMTGRKRTTFREAERRCKSVCDALPLVKVSADRFTKGASVSRYEKTIPYGTVLNTCLSFLNNCKNRYDCNVIKGN